MLTYNLTPFVITVAETITPLPQRVIKKIYAKVTVRKICAIVTVGVCMQAICIAACYPEQWPLLIICPSSMRLVWYDALLNWLPAALLPHHLHLLTVIANGKVSPVTVTPVEPIYAYFECF